MAATKKTLYHSEAVVMGPVEITVIKERQKSKYSKPEAPKPDFITLKIQGEERFYNAENEECAAYFDGLAGRTFVAVFENSREDAIINCVGESGTAATAPKTQQQAKPPVTSHGTKPAGAVPLGTQPRQREAAPVAEEPFRPLGVTVGMAINNACQYAFTNQEPFDSAVLTQRASDILRIASWLEAGNLLPKVTHQPSDNDGGAT